MLTLRTFLMAGLLALAAAGPSSAQDTASPTGPVDVTFTAALDGTEQRYVEVLPTGFSDAEPHDVLVAFHGHGSDRWQFVRDARDECRAARETAARHDMIYVSPDYRAATSWMGPAAEADTVQIIAEIKARHRVNRVFLCGGSMGGTACLTFAARHPELVDGVASMNGTANLVEYDRFQEAMTASFGGTKEQVPDEYRNRSAEFFAERLDMPVGIAVGDRDDIVPPASTLRLGERLKALGRNVLVLRREDGGHATNHADAVEILEFILKHGRKPRTEAGQDAH